MTEGHISAEVAARLIMVTDRHLRRLAADGWIKKSPDVHYTIIPVVRHRTRVKYEVHAILHAHLIPKCPHADLFNCRGREWLARQPLPDDERFAIERHVRELDRLGEDLAALDHAIAESALDDPTIKRLLTITGVNLTVAAGLMAAIGDIGRFKTPRSWSATSGGKVVEGQERLAILDQALDRLVVFDAIGLDGGVEGGLGVRPGLGHPDIMERALGLGLQALRGASDQTR